MGFFDDLQASGQRRLEFLLIALLVWICLLPIGYLVLWYAAASGKDGGAGCLGELFNVPHSHAAARKRFTIVNVILVICIIAVIVGYFVFQL